MVLANTFSGEGHRDNKPFLWSASKYWQSVQKMTIVVLLQMIIGSRLLPYKHYTYRAQLNLAPRSAISNYHLPIQMYLMSTLSFQGCSDFSIRETNPLDPRFPLSLSVLSSLPHYPSQEDSWKPNKDKKKNEFLSIFFYKKGRNSFLVCFNIKIFSK